MKMTRQENRSMDMDDGGTKEKSWVADEDGDEDADEDADVRADPCAMRDARCVDGVV